MVNVNLRNFLNGTVSQQEVADYAIGKLIGQGKPSVGEDKYCKYRGSEGVKCAIGFLIPDEEYDPKMDHNQLTAASVVDEYYGGAFDYDSVVHGTPSSFLRGLQFVHDRAYSNAMSADRGISFVAGVKQLAKNFYIEYDLVWSFGND